MNFKIKSNQACVVDKRFKRGFLRFGIIRLFSISTLLLVTSILSQQAIADTFVCKDLKAVVAEAENQFMSLKSDLIKTETAADLAKAQGVSMDELSMKFESRIYTTKTPLNGAKNCQVVEVSSEDEGAKIEQTSFDCRFDKITKLTKALREELSHCISGEVDADSEDDEFVIYVNRVESGEGYNGTSVEASTNAIEGLKLSIRKSTCMNKKTGGCEQ